MYILYSGGVVTRVWRSVYLPTKLGPSDCVFMIPGKTPEDDE